MKTASFFLILVATAACVLAAETPPETSPAADEAYQRFRAVRYTQVPRLSDVQETSRLQMKQHDESSRLAEKFYEQFPTDARKWEIIGVAVNSPRQFSGPDAAAERFLRTRVGPAETNAAVKEMAAGRLRIVEAMAAPLDLKFTAADGREVDLAKLRGKGRSLFTKGGNSFLFGRDLGLKSCSFFLL